MSDFLVGFIRTYVPIGVGVLITSLVSLGVDVDPASQAALISGVTGLVIAVYYTAVRFAAEKFPWAGIFLGVNKAPTYSEPE